MSLYKFIKWGSLNPFICLYFDGGRGNVHVYLFMYKLPQLSAARHHVIFLKIYRQESTAAILPTLYNIWRGGGAYTVRLQT